MQLLLQLAPETVKVISLDQLVLMLHAHRAIAFNIRKCLRTYLLPFLLTRLPKKNKGTTPEEISENFKAPTPKNSLMLYSTPKEIPSRIPWFLNRRGVGVGGGGEVFKEIKCNGPLYLIQFT